MGPFKNSTNNVGEFLALVHGIAMMENQKEKKIIYSDSITAISWVNKKRCQTKLERNEENNDVFVLIERAILWLKKNDFSVKIQKWETKLWGEIPADFGRK
jgi:ribonuclease HI